MKKAFIFLLVSFVSLAFLSGCDFLGNTTSNTLSIDTTTSTTSGGDSSTTTSTTTTNSNHYTEPYIGVDSLTISEDSISFTLVYVYSDIDLSITKADLYLNSSLVDSATGNTISFDNLQSGTQYSIIVTYSFDLHQGAGTQSLTFSYDFSTLAIGSPTVTGSATNITEDSFEFTVFMTDEDDVGTLVSLELYDGDTLVSTNTDFSEAFLFEDLYSNHTYQLAITYSYDINDGLGEQTNTVRVQVKTLAFELPSIIITSSNITTEGFNIEVAFTDNDGVGSLSTITLYDGETVVTSSTDFSSNFVAESLLSNHTYQVVVTYKYDLGDGQGEITSTKTLDVTTLAVTAPSVDLSAIQVTADEIEVAISFTNPDGIGQLEEIVLIDADQTVNTSKDFSSNFISNDLLSDHDYQVVITYTYNLGDGLGEITATESLDITTLKKSVPVVTLTSSSVTYDEIGMSYTYIDTDSVGHMVSIELFDQDTLLNSTTDFSTVFLTDSLLSGHLYQAVLTFSYDLGDGLGVVQDTVTVDVTTLAYTVPSPTLAISLFQYDGFTCSGTLDDVDGIATKISLEIYDGDTLIDSTSDFSSNFQIESLLSGHLYSVVFNYSYNLNDGKGDIIKSISTPVHTLSFSAPVVSVTSPNISATAFDVVIDFNDEDAVGTLDQLEIYQDNLLIETYTDFSLALGLSNTISNQEYSIVLTYHYDLLDGNGIQNKTISYTITTLQKVTPSMDVSITGVDSSSVFFKITLNDPDATGEVTTIELWSGGTLLQSLADLSAIEFSGVSDPLASTVKVVFTYNMNDGGANQTIEKSMTLSLLDFDITYNLYGGVNNDLNPNHYSYSDGNFMLYDPTREGAEFLGWYDNPDFTGSPISFVIEGTLGDLTFYAKWDIVTYDVYYNIYDDYYVESQFILTISAQESALGFYDDGTYLFVLQVYNGTVSDSGTWSWINGELIIKNDDGTLYNVTISSTQLTFTYVRSGYYENYSIPLSSWLSVVGNTGTYAPITPDFVDKFNLAADEDIISVSSGESNIGIITSSGKIISWGQNAVTGVWGTDISDNLYIPTDISYLFDLHEGESIVKVVNTTKVYLLTSEGRILYTYLKRDSMTGSYYITSGELETDILNPGEIIIDFNVSNGTAAYLTNQNRFLMSGNNEHGEVGAGSNEDSLDLTDITANFGLNTGELIAGFEVNQYRSSLWTSEGRLFLWGSAGTDDIMGVAPDGSNLPIDVTNLLSLNSGEKITSVSLTIQRVVILTTENRILA